MKVAQAGFLNVVALMGCTLSEAQETLLAGVFKFTRDEEIGKYGRDNPWVMVNVLGQFPCGPEL